jgi:hypothetical protein
VLVVEVVLLAVVVGVETMATVVDGIEDNTVVVIGCILEDALSVGIVDTETFICDICVVVGILAVIVGTVPGFRYENWSIEIAESTTPSPINTIKSLSSSFNKLPRLYLRLMVRERMLVPI